jgi:glycosyltransferase involved in cell wall biosynthesis
VAQRLQRFNFLRATPLYPPSKFHGNFRSGAYGDYILSDARLDAAKRLDLLIDAVALMQHPMPVVLTSTGPAHAALRAHIDRLGLTDRITMTGYVSDARLLELYAEARCVYYAPFDEDYGFTTVQALAAGRPVVTTHDAGGTLEFVRHGQNGLVVAPQPGAIAVALDTLASDIDMARRLGSAGPSEVADIDWEQVCQALLR